MNNFTLVGVGNLARNPEITAKGTVAFVRFCLVGFDLAEPDDQVDRTRGVSTTIWFMAFDEIGDDIARNARKGDQLIVTARVRPFVEPDTSLQQGRSMAGAGRRHASSQRPAALEAATEPITNLWRPNPMTVTLSQS